MLIPPSYTLTQTLRWRSIPWNPEPIPRNTLEPATYSSQYTLNVKPSMRAYHTPRPQLEYLTPDI